MSRRRPERMPEPDGRPDAVGLSGEDTGAPEPEADMPGPGPAGDVRDIAERSRRRALEALGHTLRQYSDQEDVPELSDDDLPLPAAPGGPAAEGEPEPEYEQEQEPEPRDGLAPPPPPRPPRPRLTMDGDGIITLHYADTGDGPDGPEPEEPEYDEEPGYDGEPEYDEEPGHDGEPEYDGEPEPEYDEPEREPPAPDGAHARRGGHTARSRRPADAPSLAERLLRPVIRVLATVQVRRQLKEAEAKNWPDPVPQRKTPELPLKQAAGYYARQVRPLRTRCRVALALTLVLAWISLSLPMAGMLRVSMPLQAGVSLVLMLAVMMTALDVVTAGLRQLSEFRPGPEAIVVTALIVSGIDAALVLLGYGNALPFCAVGAAALTSALWGECLRCTALSRTYMTAAAARTPAALSCGETGGQEGKSLFRSVRSSLSGLVRRSESQELSRSTYVGAAPVLMGAALVLSVWASIGKGLYFLHTLSALLSVCTSFAAFFSFPLSYVFASRRLRDAGVALAGYAGCAEIGKNRRVIITDEDLFPPGTVRFSEINILEGVKPGEVVGCTTSLLRRLGCGVTSLFDELVERRGYRVPEADEFRCHEGGGLSAVIGGERILVGTAGFMNLMGIRLPQNLNPKNAVCTAVAGELVAVFVIDYVPVTSVQQALLMLLRGRTRTVFAIRDFNITPLMLRQLFRLPSDSFHFPSYLDRCRIGAATDRGARIDAVLIRNGALPLAEAAEAGRKLYLTCRITSALSLLGAAAGMLIMFLLCRAGSFDTATPGNVLSFMTLWSLPMLILSVGQNR